MTTYALTVETVGQERIPSTVPAWDAIRCGFCPDILMGGSTVWVFDDVPLGSSPGSACCTPCMLLRPSNERFTARGRLQVLGIESLVAEA